MGVVGNKTYCDICGNFHANFSEFDLRYSGYFYGTPKFKIRCNTCNGKILDRVLSQVLGYVVQSVKLESNELIALEAEIERENMSEVIKNKKNTMSVEQINSTINWSEIDQLIDNGNCKIANLATSLNANPAELRNIFINHYGNRIMFARGRNGGVRWNKETA